MLRVASKLHAWTEAWRLLLVHNYALRQRLVHIFLHFGAFSHVSWRLNFVGFLQSVGKVDLVLCGLLQVWLWRHICINLIRKEVRLALLSFVLIFFTFGLLAVLSKLWSVKDHLWLETDDAHLSNSFNVFGLIIWFVEIVVCFIFNSLFLNNHISTIILRFTHWLNRNRRITLMLIYLIQFLLEQSFAFKPIDIFTFQPIQIFV